eukprot:1158622-Pelagomonas_calceolata.AAC.3
MDGCRYVSRSVEEDGHPRVSVSDKDEIHAEEAQPGDILLLKGHVWPGNMNCGVVHKSPLLDNCGCGEEHPVPEVTRLVLTIDTATDWDTRCQLENYKSQPRHFYFCLKFGSSFELRNMTD